MRVSAAPGGSYGMALRLSGGVGLRASLEGLRQPLPIKVDFSAHSCYRTEGVGGVGAEADLEGATGGTADGLPV